MEQMIMKVGGSKAHITIDVTSAQNSSKTSADIKIRVTSHEKPVAPSEDNSVAKGKLRSFFSSIGNGIKSFIANRLGLASANRNNSTPAPKLGPPSDGIHLAPVSKQNSTSTSAATTSAPASHTPPNADANPLQKQNAVSNPPAPKDGAVTQSAPKSDSADMRSIQKGKAFIQQRVRLRTPTEKQQEALRNCIREYKSAQIAKQFKQKDNIQTILEQLTRPKPNTSELNNNLSKLRAAFAFKSPVTPAPKAALDRLSGMPTTDVYSMLKQATDPRPNMKIA